jgi:hypothetical protein
MVAQAFQPVQFHLRRAMHANMKAAIAATKTYLAPWRLGVRPIVRYRSAERESKAAGRENEVHPALKAVEKLQFH